MIVRALRDPALFGGALIAGASFTVAAWFAWDGAAVVAWKGAGVALLALWAWCRAMTRGGRQIALVLALGALGDVLLDTAGFVVGAVAFLLGHVVAIDLYRRHRGGPDWRAGVAAGLVAALGAALTRDPGVVLYQRDDEVTFGGANVSRCRLKWR